MPMTFEKIEDIQDAIVTVMGLGRFSQGSGVGAAKWLMRHGAQIVITDLKSEHDLQESVDLVMEWYSEYRKAHPDRTIYQPVFVLGKHEEEQFTNVQLVVKNPDVPGNSAYVKLAEANDVRVESDVSLFFHYYQHPIYTVTGTRGKSTTTALIGAMLKSMNEKAVVAGNIMHSPLEDLDWMLKEEEPVPVILEMSSWLLESLTHIDRGPKIALLTNISKDHLDRYGSYQEYIDTKAQMFAHQTPEQMAVLNYDDETVRQIGEQKVKSKKYWFSTKPLPEGMEGAYLDATGDVFVRLGEDRKLCHVSEWPSLKGEHNQQNALGAAVVAALAGVSDEGICNALKGFEGLSGRQQTIREFDGVTYVNDTTSTTPTATIAALKRFGEENDRNHIVLIVGGKAKGSESDFPALAEEIKNTCKHVVYLEGSHTNEMEQAIGADMPDSHATNMKEAVEMARNAASEGDVVLLSPAGSSFDLFKNVYDRGGQFVEEVKNLK